MKPTMLISGVLFLALVGQVELFKLFKQPAPAQPPQPQPQPQPQLEHVFEQERLYSQQAPLLLPQARPLLASGPYFAQSPQIIQQQQELPPAELIRQSELAGGVKGGAKGTKGESLIRAPLPQLAQPPVHQAYSYLVVRPIQQHQYQFLDPYRFGARGGLFGSHLHATRPTATYFRQNEGTKGGQRPPREDEQQQQQQEIVEQHQEQQVIEQHHEVQEQQPEPQQPLPPQPQPQQPAAIVIPIAPGKEGKLRALLDKIKSKLTLGSTYEVVGEEIVHPAPAPAPQPPAQPYQQPIEQQKQQQQVEEHQFEQQQQQQQQGFEEQQQQIVQEQKVEQIQQQQQQQQLAAELPSKQQAAKGQQAIKVDETKGQQPPRQQQEELKGQKLVQEESKGNYGSRYEENRVQFPKKYPERPSIQQQPLATTEHIRQTEQSEQSLPLKASADGF